MDLFTIFVHAQPLGFTLLPFASCGPQAQTLWRLHSHRCCATLFAREGRRQRIRHLKSRLAVLNVLYFPCLRGFVHNDQRSALQPQDLKDHMRGLGGDVVRADVMTDQGGRSRGCGIVEFANAEQASQAIEQLNNSDLKGRMIFVREVGCLRVVHGLVGMHCRLVCRMIPRKGILFWGHLLFMLIFIFILRTWTSPS